MKLKDYILGQINSYFKIESDDEKHMELITREGYTPFPFVHNEKTTEEYIIFDMPSSFQINILDYQDDATISVTFDSQFELYYREKTKQERVIEIPHKQNFYQLTFIIEGEVDVVLEGERQCLSADSICVMNRNVKQLEERTSPYTAIHICFKPEFIQELPILQSKQVNVGTELQDFFKINQNYSEQIDYLIFQPISCGSNSTIEDLILVLFQEMLKKEVGYLEICKYYLQRLFHNIQKPSEYLCLHTCFSRSQERTVFEETLKYIIDAKRKLTREEIGNALNYNGNYISRVFQKNTGQTLAKYIRDICLSHAAHLLLNTDMQIKDIILQIGYENKTVFYKNFKEKYGINPGEYRDRKK